MSSGLYDPYIDKHTSFPSRSGEPPEDRDIAEPIPAEKMVATEQDREMLVLCFLCGNVWLLVLRSRRWDTLERPGTRDMCDPADGNPGTVRAMVEPDPSLVPGMLDV